MDPKQVFSLAKNVPQIDIFVCFCNPKVHMYYAVNYTLFILIFVVRFLKPIYPHASLGAAAAYNHPKRRQLSAKIKKANWLTDC